MKARLPLSAMSYTKRLEAEARQQVQKIEGDEIRRLARKETKKAMMQMEEDYGSEFDAIVLYTLHRSFGFGKKRLTRFQTAYFDAKNHMKETYDLDEKQGDYGWFCKRELKKIGVDVNNQ